MKRPDTEKRVVTLMRPENTLTLEECVDAVNKWGSKHPDCEDRCQILEHKGYHDCTNTGRCELLEAQRKT